MRDIDNIESMCLAAAEVISGMSNDPITKVGAVICSGSPILGWNKLSCFDHIHFYWSQDVKHNRVIHAEISAIGAAARAGVSTDGATMYCTLFPCLNCALAMIAAGIKKLVVQKAHYAGNDERFLEPLRRFHECDVEVKIVEWPKDAEV